MMKTWLFSSLSNLVADWHDKWITWRTGKDKQQRQWEEWRDSIIDFRSYTVAGYFHQFNHIIELDPDKIWNYNEPFGWVPVKEFKQFEFPQKELGDNTVINWFRVVYDSQLETYVINELAGSDKVFAATNNEHDALLIALKFS